MLKHPESHYLIHDSYLGGGMTRTYMDCFTGPYPDSGTPFQRENRTEDTK